MSGFFGFVGIIIVLVLGFFVARGIWNYGYDKFGPKTYTAFFYYDPNDLSKHWSSNVDSLEGCRDWVDEQAARDFDGYYDYECGVNCKTKPGFTILVCKETLE